jgi:hypothetical protein
MQERAGMPPAYGPQRRPITRYRDGPSCGGKEGTRSELYTDMLEGCEMLCSSVSSQLHDRRAAGRGWEVLSVKCSRGPWGRFDVRACRAAVHSAGNPPIFASREKGEARPC